MKKLVLIASILGALSSVPALAQTDDRWVEVIVSREGNTFFLKASDIRKAMATKSLPTYWLKMTNSRTREEKLVFEEVDCSRRMTKSSFMVLTSADGNRKSGPLNTGWEPVIPDSAGEALFAVVCPTS
jgi:hypothetical protein